jgi:hypothetical protein
VRASSDEGDAPHVTDADKKALIKKLGAESSKAFDARYSEGPNRQWFVGKIIDSLLAKGVADANIEQQTKDIIFDSGVAVNARINGGFSASGLTNMWKQYDEKKSRIQIIYGMIAMNPEFLDSTNADYFSFILERRFRAIQRMAFYVNPNNVRNVFAYPGDPCGNDMKVNKFSDDFWSGAKSGTLPFILKSAGKSDPETADENLFKKSTDCDRNLFACDPVSTTLHMDALRVAKDHDKLMMALAIVGDHYLKIDNPLGHFANYRDGQRLVAVTSAPVSAGSDVEIPLGNVGRVLTFSTVPLTPAVLAKDDFIGVQGNFFMLVLGSDSESFLIKGVNPVRKKIKVATLANSYGAGAKLYATRTQLPFYKSLPYHFITDSRPSNALFEQLSVKAADLQVGDHVYVINHPLYLMYYPTGAWGGEHSFITEIGTRDSSASTFRSALKVEGHGLNNTLLGMTNDMLDWINTVLGILQSLTKLHLDNLKANDRTSTPNKVNVLQRTDGGIALNIFEYNMPYTQKLYREGGKSQTINTGFVIREQASDQTVFQVFNANGKDSTVVPTAPQPDVQLLVAFIGSNFSTEQFTPSKWGVKYLNPQSASIESQPLFENDNKTPKVLTFDDLAKSKPFFVTDDAADAFVTRPRIDFSAAYQTFLKNNGAI